MESYEIPHGLVLTAKPGHQVLTPLARPASLNALAGERQRRPYPVALTATDEQVIVDLDHPGLMQVIERTRAGEGSVTGRTFWLAPDAAIRASVGTVPAAPPPPPPPPPKPKRERPPTESSTLQAQREAAEKAAAEALQAAREGAES